MKRYIALLLLASLLMTGCNIENEEALKESELTYTSTAASSTAATEQTTVQSTTPAQSTAVLAPDEVIPEAIQTPRVEGNRLSYTIVNVYADGDYYTVQISGVKLDSTAEADLETTYINGELYGDFRLDLMKRGELIDTLKINVPRDDRFLILESVTENLSYGCELISNKREFSIDDYPDLIQLDFHILNEVETPQYARFFSVTQGRLTEVPVYEDGIETAPYGTHVELESAGVMTQHLVVSVYDGSYTVKQFEYTFDPEQMNLTRKEVRFTG